MKPIFSKIRVLGTAALALFLTASCSDILDEQPRSSYDPKTTLPPLTNAPRICSRCGSWKSMLP